MGFMVLEVKSCCLIQHEAIRQRDFTSRAINPINNLALPCLQ